VDDTDTIQLEQDTQEQPTVARHMQSTMDTWEGGIRVTGGALEHNKSLWYFISFIWDDGVWIYAKMEETTSYIYQCATRMVIKSR
jgi:hypothetical protein